MINYFQLQLIVSWMEYRIIGILVVDNSYYKF